MNMKDYLDEQARPKGRRSNDYDPGPSRIQMGPASVDPICDLRAMDEREGVIVPRPGDGVKCTMSHTTKKIRQMLRRLIACDEQTEEMTVLSNDLWGEWHQWQVALIAGGQAGAHKRVKSSKGVGCDPPLLAGHRIFKITTNLLETYLFGLLQTVWYCRSRRSPRYSRRHYCICILVCGTYP